MCILFFNQRNLNKNITISFPRDKGRRMAHIGSLQCHCHLYNRARIVLIV